MQAIITKYIPPTNYKPSRIRAKCERGSIILSWDSELDTKDNHRAAIATEANASNFRVTSPTARCGTSTHRAKFNH